MGKEIRIEFEHAFYHVISRGNTRSRIFKKDRDRKKFLEYLQAINDKYSIKIHAYCLMGNHYHLLLETPQGNLSKAMHKLNTSYTNFYNYHHKRSGHLFSGRYRAILVEKDNYAQVLSAYIHLNPVRAGIVTKPDEYEWSSFKYYSKELVNLPDFMSNDLILSYFDRDIKVASQKYISYMKERADSRKNPLNEIKAGVILGSEHYIEWIRKNIGFDSRLGEKIKQSQKQKSAKSIEKHIRKLISDDMEINEKLKRKILIYLLRENTPHSLKEIGREFGIKASAINMIVKRFKDKIAREEELKNKIDMIIEKVKMCNV